MITPTTPPPPREALEHFRSKGWKIGFDYRDVWRSEHAGVFTVAKAMQLDILRDIRNAVDEALARGKTLRQFKKELEPVLGKRGWLGKVRQPDGSTVELGTPRRLKIIYDTNMRTARAAGQWERIERNRDAIPYLMYDLGPSKEHRLQHVEWEGLILSVDDPFWDTHVPPNGWGCRCRVRRMTKRDIDKRGGLSKAPEIETTPWENKRTGQIQDIPKGIDPGWDYNPGKVRLGKAREFAQDKAAEFKDVVGTAKSPVAFERRVVPSALSTLDNISADHIDEVLQQLPDAEERLNKVRAFVQDKGTKTLIIRQSEMGARNKAAEKIEGRVLDYLDNEQRKYGRRNYTTNNPSDTLGFTSASYNHVVIKGTSEVNFKKADKKQLADELHQAVKTAAVTRKPVPPKRPGETSKPADKPEIHAVFSAAASKEAQLVATWVHELGHQIHHWAGAPNAPVGAKYLTRYSEWNNDKYEYHAEQFAAWLLNRDELAKFDTAAAQHFDGLIETAIKSKGRKR